MLDRFICNIYVSNISTVIIATLVAIFVWSIIGAVLKQQMRMISSVVVVLSVAVILYTTVFSRGETAIGAQFAPFASFVRAIEQPEAYRSMLMNVILFVPLGLALPFIFRSKVSKRVLLAVLSGLVLSVMIEFSQYVFALGFAETDDVICNTLGTAVGSCAYPLSLKLRGFFKTIRK